MELLRRGIWWGAGVSATLVAAVFLASARAGDPADAYEQGRECLEKGNFDRAIVDFAEAIRLNPGDVRAYTGRGEAYERKGNFDRAAADYREAIARDPNSAPPYLRMARLLRDRLDRSKEADEWIGKLMKLNRGSCAANVGAAEYYRAGGMIDEAMSYAHKALQIVPNDRGALLLAIRCATENASQLQADQKQDEADRWYDRARRYAELGTGYHPKDVEMYLMAADVEARCERMKKAVEWLQRGLLATGNERQLRWALANALIDAERIDEAGQVAEQLRSAKYPAPLLGFLQARIEYARGNRQGALAAFEGLYRALAPWPGLAKTACVYVGKCHRELGNPDREQMAYETAILIDPQFISARTALAESLLSAGKIDKAAAQCRELVKLGKASAGTKVMLARIAVLKNLRLEPAERKWDEAEKLLSEAAGDAPDLIDVPLLRAELLVAQGRSQEAESLLRKVCEKNPDKVEPLSALVSLAQRGEDWEKAEKLLGQAEQKLGDRADLRLARARCLAGRYGAEAGPQLQQLGDKKQAFSDAERRKLWTGLSNIALEINDGKSGKLLAQRAVELQPDDVRAWFTLLEIALGNEDAAAVQKAAAEMRRIAGDGPLWHYAEGARLGMLAKKGEPRTVTEAFSHLSEAIRLRPSWSRPSLAAAGIYDQQGKTVLALQNYLDAIDRGERSPAAARRAAQLLWKANRAAEALGLIRWVQQDARPEADPQEVRARRRPQPGDLDVALEAARKAAAKSEDFLDHVWLSQLLAAKRQNAEADGKTESAAQLLKETEKSLRRAAELSPRNPEAWEPLVKFLAAAGRTDEALDWLDRVWPTAEPQAIARTASALLQAETTSKEQLQRGEKVLTDALQKLDRPVPLLIVLADSCTAHDRYQQAETLYREVLQKDAASVVAMNNLAFLLGVQRVKLGEAMALVNRAIEGSGPLASLLDTRACVYTALGQPDKALADLDRAIADGATPVRLFHQALAYQQAGRKAEAAQAIQRAKQQGLTGAMLHPLERAAYQAMAKGS